ncbi:hypothetical protein D3248_12225 [Leucobacter zeae]|nr:hypothetical protein [Leucobacter zeae]
MTAGPVQEGRAPTGADPVRDRGTVPAGIAWNAWFRGRIADARLCPVCTDDRVVDGICGSCAADLRGGPGQAIWEASLRAAAALEARERLLTVASGRAGGAVASEAARAPAIAGAGATPGTSSAPRTSTRPRATVQSLFALAGAGLVAIAAIVFTFFNPDLEDRVARSAIVGVVTVLFLAAAGWLARRGTRFSAEAFGWLGVVFVGIDVWALSRIGASSAQSWQIAAGATGLAAAALLLLGSRSGLRAWSSAAVIGLTVVPAMVGYSGGAPLGFAAGHLGVVVVAAALRERLPAARGLRPAERVGLSALQIAAAVSAVPALAMGLERTWSAAAVGALLFGFALAALFASRHGARVFWSLVVGAAGAAVLPSLAITAHGAGSWQIVLLTTGAAVGAVLVAGGVAAFAARLRTLVRPAVGWAALSVPAVCSVPAAAFLAAELGPGTRLLDEGPGGWPDSLPFVVCGAVLAVGSAAYSRLVAGHSSAQGWPALQSLRTLSAIVSVVFAELTALCALRLALAAAGVTGAALDSASAAAALLLAIVVTLVRRVSLRSWGTVLIVSAVPSLGVIAGVIDERSGWTALTTVAMCALALVLLVTRREWLGGYLRVGAAALVVPSLAVTAVCLGAEFLADSASPAVLPAIAALVAIALAGSGILPEALGRRGSVLRPVGEVRIALEASALVTGAIAVWLALERAAAGLGTACIVLLLIGLGAALMSALGKRRAGWWIAAASFTGSLWCVLGLRGVETPEMFVLPPAIGAALVAVVRSIRSSRSAGPVGARRPIASASVALYAVGLGAAIAPSLALLAIGAEGELVRAGALLLASWSLLAVGSRLVRVPRSRRPLAALAAPTFAAAMLAGVAGALHASRSGLAGADLALCLVVSGAGAAAMLLAGRGLRRALPRLRRSPWPEVPGAIALAAGCWGAIDGRWPTIWAMWGLMLAYLVAMPIVAHRRIAGRGPAIPVPVLFAVAFVTAVVAWSPRELRVEVFSLPLGLLLLLAGAIAMRGRGAAAPGPRSSFLAPRAIAAWPLAARGSWAMLGPGVVVLMLASILSTFTDPQTWRAILVMLIALAAMLVGARLRLAAPFVIGLVVLPIENVFVFAVQIGRGIDSMPWWITLATIGAVLLSVAVISEQRAGERQTLLARVRDLA